MAHRDKAMKFLFRKKVRKRCVYLSGKMLPFRGPPITIPPSLPGRIVPLKGPPPTMPPLLPGRTVPFKGPPITIPPSLPGRTVPLRGPPKTMPPSLPGRKVPFKGPPMTKPPSLPGKIVPLRGPPTISSSCDFFTVIDLPRSDFHIHSPPLLDCSSLQSAVATGWNKLSGRFRDRLYGDFTES
jgi:hypothetical protein